MAKLKVLYEKTPDGPVAVAAYASATSYGDGSTADTSVVVVVQDRGRVTIARGTVEASATATTSGDGAYATAETNVEISGGDLTLARTETSSGGGGTSDSSWASSTSETRFFAIDIEGIELGQGPVEISAETDRVVVCQPVESTINTATFDVDVEAIGSSTLVDARASLMTSDGLSDSTLVTLATADTVLL